MEPARAIPIITDACHALHEAHKMGIVHRDLKPENIFVCQQSGLKDYAKLLDFGLAKVTEAQMRPGSMILTQEGMVFGTPEFMSPEQARGQTLDSRSDIYSLACILYEALTGKLPFDARTPMEYVGKHVTAQPIALDERVPGRRFPAGLGEVLDKALSKHADSRYQSVIEFADALAPFKAARASDSGVHPERAVSDFGHAAVPVMASAPVASVKPKMRTPRDGAPESSVPHAASTPSTKTLVVVAFSCMVLGGLGAIIVMRLLGS